MQKLAGQKFGTLTVQHTHHYATTPSGVMKYKAMTLCDCGETYEVELGALKRLVLKTCPRCRDGELPPIDSHELSSTWHGMHTRCYDKTSRSYAYYGARGIAVCDRWRKVPGDLVASRKAFWSFVKDMGDRPEGHSVDRIDNDGHYEPGNCRWATSSEQNANKRRRPAKPKKLLSRTERSAVVSRMSRAAWDRRLAEWRARLQDVELEL